MYIVGWQLRFYDESEQQLSGTEEVVRKIEDPKTCYTHVRDIVGNIIECVCRVKSPFRKNVSIEAYVDEDGLYTKGIWFRIGDRPIPGDIAFTAVALTQEPHFIPLTEEEVDWIRDRFDGQVFSLVDDYSI